MFCIALHVCTLYVLYCITCLFILCLVLHYVFVHSMSCLALHVCTFYDLYRILCLYILWLVLHYMFVHSMACIALHVCTFYGLYCITCLYILCVIQSYTHTQFAAHLQTQYEDNTTLTLTSSEWGQPNSHTYELSIRITQLSHLRAQYEDNSTRLRIFWNQLDVSIVLPLAWLST